MIANARWSMSLGSILLALAAACSGPPPSTPQSSPKEGGDDATATTQTVSPGAVPINPGSVFEPYDSETCAEDETIIRRLTGNVNSLNPLFWNSTADDAVQSLLYAGPFIFDAAFNWDVNPDMVDSFEEAPDHLSATLKLKEGLSWQDGEPLTAEDIAFSWEAMLNENVPCLIKDGPDRLESVEAIDSLTVVFTYKEALATNLWNISFSIIPEHIYNKPAERKADPTLKSSDYYANCNFEGVIGSGPYKLAEFVPNDHITLERWEDYWGPKPHFKRVIFKIQPDQNTALLLFKQGELDAMRLSQQQFVKETGDEDFAKHGVKVKYSQWNFAYIGWNMDGSNPFFSDLKVRRAMGHAFDYDKIIKEVMYGLATQCHGIFHPDSWMFNKNVQALDFDLEKAAAMLDEAGWKVSDEDGWRYKEIDGAPVKFEFELILPQGASSSAKIAAIYQQDLKRLGVTMKLRQLEWAAMQELTVNHEFEATMAAWGTGTDPDTSDNLWMTSTANGGRNYVSYSNARVDELFVLGRKEFDKTKRAAIYGEIQKLIYDEQPYLFITNPVATSAFHKRVRGVETSPRGADGFYPGALSWWVPRDEAMRQ